jgi:hypothetical protein
MFPDYFTQCSQVLRGSYDRSRCLMNKLVIRIHANVNIFETSSWICRKYATFRNTHSYDEVAGFSAACIPRTIVLVPVQLCL